MTTYEDCPHCHGTGKIEVAATKRVLSHGTPSTNARWAFEPATPKQLAAVQRMAEERDLGYQTPTMKWQASNLISQMSSIPKVAPQPQAQPDPEPEPTEHPEPTPQREKVEPLPLMMVSKITDGRYAITADDNTETLFLRKYTHKPDAVNRLAGCTVLQHRIAEDWNNHTIYWPSGGTTTISSRYKGTVLPEAWAQVFIDPQGAAHRFSEREHRCCSCGTNLTDARSRHFGIGPECEKSRPDVIGWVTETIGPFVPGTEQE